MKSLTNKIKTIYLNGDLNNWEYEREPNHKKKKKNLNKIYEKSLYNLFSAKQVLFWLFNSICVILKFKFDTNWFNLSQLYCKYYKLVKKC